MVQNMHQKLTKKMESFWTRSYCPLLLPPDLSALTFFLASTRLRVKTEMSVYLSVGLTSSVINFDLNSSVPERGGALDWHNEPRPDREF